MRFLVQWLIAWPARVARHLTWLAPLFARITAGWVFLWSGWSKLSSLPQVTENFIGWGIPAPHFLALFVSGVEFFAGLFLLVGLFTRVSTGALGVTMIVAIRSAKWSDLDSLESLLGLDEFEYLALFLWLGIAGAGPLALDHWLQRVFGRPRDLRRCWDCTPRDERDRRAATDSMTNGKSSRHRAYQPRVVTEKRARACQVVHVERAPQTIITQWA